MGNRITRRLRELEDTALLEPVRRSGETLFAGGAYSIGAAADMSTRRAAYRLVYALYLEKEYTMPHPSRMWLSIFDALPETTTLAVKHEGNVVAALTVVFDSPLGLPADQLYGRELDNLRRAGRRPAEIVSLGLSPDAQNSGEILVRLFNCAYLLAYRIRSATDFVSTVNPRHVGFYKRTMLFEKIGRQRDYDKVDGAPAVLLRIGLDKGEECIRRARWHVEARSALARTLFPRFYSPAREIAVTTVLRRSSRSMSEGELRYFFLKKTDLLRTASPRQRQYIEDCYPFCNLTLEKSDTREYRAV